MGNNFLSTKPLYNDNNQKEFETETNDSIKWYLHKVSCLLWSNFLLSEKEQVVSQEYELDWPFDYQISV